MGPRSTSPRAISRLPGKGRRPGLSKCGSLLRRGWWDMCGWGISSPPRLSVRLNFPGGDPSKDRLSSPILRRQSIGGASACPCCVGRGRRPPPCGISLLPRVSWLGWRPSWTEGWWSGGFWEDSGGVLSRPGLDEELLLFSFLGLVDLEASSDLTLSVFCGLVAVDGNESFLLITPSPFFFILSLFDLTHSVLTLAFTFWFLSFLLLSDWGLDADLAEGLVAAAVLLEAGDFVVSPACGFEEIGGVFTGDGTSSMGSSRTGVASPRSMDCWDDSSSSPGFFFFTFLLLTTLVLDFVPDDEEDGGWWAGAPLSSLPLLPLPSGE